MHRWLVLVVALIAVALSGRPACAQGSEVLAHYGTSPETLADVILVLKPDATFPLDVPIPTERVISGSILRIDKGAAPQRIVQIGRAHV